MIGETHCTSSAHSTQNRKMLLKTSLVLKSTTAPLPHISEGKDNQSFSRNKAQDCIEQPKPMQRRQNALQWSRICTNGCGVFRFSSSITHAFDFIQVRREELIQAPVSSTVDAVARSHEQQDSTRGRELRGHVTQVPGMAQEPDGRVQPHEPRVFSQRLL